MMVKPREIENNFDGGAVTSLTFSSKYQLLAIGRMKGDGASSCLTLYSCDKKEYRKIKFKTINDHVIALRFFNVRSILVVATMEVIYFVNYIENSIEGKIDLYGVKNIRIGYNDELIGFAGKKNQIWGINKNECLWELNNYNGYESTKNIKLINFAGSFDINKNSKKELSYVNIPPMVDFYSDDNDSLKLIIGGDNSGCFKFIDTQYFQEVDKILNAPLQIIDYSIGAKNQILGIVSKVPKGAFVWDLIKKERISNHFFNEKNIGYASIALHPFDLLIGGGSIVGFVSIFDLKAEKFVFFEQLHTGAVRSVIFSDDGKFLFSGGDDGKVFVIDINNDISIY